MKYLLDTCTISYFFKKEINVINNMKSKSPSSIFVSVITVHEIEYGIMLEPSRERNLRPVFENFLSQITVINLDSKIAGKAAAIRSSLKQTGNIIGAYDIFIGATAIQNQLVCVTSNTKEFNRIPELNLEDWRNKL